MSKHLVQQSDFSGVFLVETQLTNRLTNNGFTLTNSTTGRFHLIHVASNVLSLELCRNVETEVVGTYLRTREIKSCLFLHFIL